MRDQYHEDLDAITHSLVEITRLAGSAINRATQALLDADLQAAEKLDAPVSTPARGTQAARSAKVSDASFAPLPQKKPPAAKPPSGDRVALLEELLGRIRAGKRSA